MMSVTIRSLEVQDYPDWLVLWDGNNNGERDEAVTAETWKRLLSGNFPVYGLCAVENGKPIGLVHYVLHPTTGSIAPICYMQDVYVDPAHRRKGIARRLIEHLAVIAAREKWGRMYWLAESDNKAAQTLYKTLGVKLDFTLHVLLP